MSVRLLLALLPVEELAREARIRRCDGPLCLYLFQYRSIGSVVAPHEVTYDEGRAPRDAPLAVHENSTIGLPSLLDPVADVHEQTRNIFEVRVREHQDAVGEVFRKVRAAEGARSVKNVRDAIALQDVVVLRDEA